MELSGLDPFGDYLTEGYLRNHFKERDLTIIARLEAAAFEDQVHETLRILRRHPNINYEHILDTHRRLFASVYPWAGQDRSENAPDIAIAKAGYKTLFAHPADVRRAAEYALQRAADAKDMRAHPGEIFGYLAHAHPFLEGNGRTILTVYADLCRRADFYIEWGSIDKHQFLRSLTDELLTPGSAMDSLVLTYVRPGAFPLKGEAVRLRRNFRKEL